MGNKNSKKKNGSESNLKREGSEGSSPNASASASASANASTNHVRETMKDSDWIIHRVLGKGAFGTVLAGELKEYKGTLFALKYMNKAYVIEQNMVEKVNTEKEIMKMVNHPFICKLHYAYQTPTDIVMCLSLLIGGDLQYHLDSEKKLNEMGVRFYMAQIMHAVSYLHSLGIVHRDLKPGNILLDSKGNSYITDFGISAVLKPGQFLKSNCGTLHYMPPEVYRNELYNSGMDMWALGVIMYEMLYLTVPFDANSEKELMSVVCSREPKWIPKNSKAAEIISEETTDLVKRLLDKNKTTRISAKQAMEHKFFALTDWDQVVGKSYLPPFTPKAGQAAAAMAEQHENEERGGNGKTITQQQQALFKTWDYNPGPPEDIVNAVASPSIKRSASKQKVIESAAPLTQEDFEEEDETGAISMIEYRRQQEEKKISDDKKKKEAADAKQALRDSVKKRDDATVGDDHGDD